MFLKRSRWWLREEELSPCRSITSCMSQCSSPPSSCSLLLLSIVHTLLSHRRSSFSFPSHSAPHLLAPYLSCVLLHNHRSLLFNGNRRQLTFMRLDIPVQPHSYVQWAKGQKPPHTPQSPSPTCSGLQRSWVTLNTQDIIAALKW